MSSGIGFLCATIEDMTLHAFPNLPRVCPGLSATLCGLFGYATALSGVGRKLLMLWVCIPCDAFLGVEGESTDSLLHDTIVAFGDLAAHFRIVPRLHRCGLYEEEYAEQSDDREVVKRMITDGLVGS